MWKFNSFLDPDQRIIYLFVTLLLELSSANHTEAPSRINAAVCHVTLPYTRTARYARIACVSPLTKFTGLVTARNIFSFERLLEITRRRTKCELFVHPSCQTHQLSNYRASLTAHFEQILIRLNNKFRIITTKRVVVITRRLSEWIFHTRWHQHHKHKHNIFWSFKPNHRQRKLLFCLNIPNRAFPLEIKLSLDELMSMQNQQMGAIFRIHF